MKWTVSCIVITAAAISSQGFAQEGGSVDQLLGTVNVGTEAAAPAAAPAPEPAGVGTAPAEAAPSAVVSTDDAHLAAEQEEARRQADEMAGAKLFAEAAKLEQDGKLKDAQSKYEEVLRKMPDRPATDAMRQEAVAKIPRLLLERARAEYELDQLDEALRLVEEAVRKGGKTEAEANGLKAKIESRKARVEKVAAVPVPTYERPEIASKTAQIEALFVEGRQLFAVEEYDKAETSFESILLLDPYHRDAMRYLRKIEERRIVARNTQREATVKQFSDEVVRRWAPPIRRVVSVPGPAKTPDQVPSDEKNKPLMQRLNDIIIPQIEFRNANIHDVVDFLIQASQANDKEGIGINIILRIDQSAAPVAAATPAATDADPWGMGGGGAAAMSVAAAPATPGLTISLRQVSLGEAIRYVATLSNLKYRIDDGAVVIHRPEDAMDPMMTRFYPIMASAVEIFQTAAAAPESETKDAFGFGGIGGAGTRVEKNDAKVFFERNGVKFPAGSSITYNTAISKLIVKNTAENLAKLETILPQIDVIPSQIEIESRFVEINQDDLAELGFEWLLDNSWSLANKKSPGAGGSTGQIVMSPNAADGGNQGFTKGLRYMNETAGGILPASRSATTVNTLLGGIVSMSGILTNPDLSMVLHALDQKGGVDLLSAPRVTTRSGNNAQIQVITEIIYPTEYEEQSSANWVGGLDAYRPPIPSQFETRDTGILLNVTPTVGPDNYTIDLTLVPEVAELVDWIDYGPQGQTQQAVLDPDNPFDPTAFSIYAYPILQPVFASRNATTSVVIWDGQTIVIGGMIRENVTRMNDRIPLIGDIPLLGRLFRSDGDYSKKSNLMIFVTAKIVDPSGREIRKSGEISMLPSQKSE